MLSPKSYGVWSATASVCGTGPTSHRPDFSPERYARRIKLIDDRLCVLAQGPYQDRDATRLAKRLDRYIDASLRMTFWPICGASREIT